MTKKNKETLKESISKVNQTLDWYEKDFISVQRSPNSNKERCTSFEQFVEARFNFELSRIPEFEYLVNIFEGKLFGLIELKDSDPGKKKFKLATFSLPSDEIIKGVISLLPESEPLIYEELDKIKNYLGGNMIKFNNVKKKIKIIIE